MRFRRCLIWQFVVSLILAGCGTKQFGPEGRELMKPLQTAISSKNLQWIDVTERKIEEQMEKGTLSDSEVTSLTSIIEDCREGDWKRAQNTLQGLVDGQRATSEDVAHLKEGESRRPTGEHRKRAGRSK